MIYELLSTALLACSLGSSALRDNPKRVMNIPDEYQTYTLQIVGFAWFNFTESKGSTLSAHWDEWTQTSTLTGQCATAVFEAGGTDQDDEVPIAVSLNFNRFYDEDRFEASFEVVGLNPSTYVVENDNDFYWESSDVDDSVEMFFHYDANKAVSKTVTISITFPFVYKIDYETFGTQENNGVSWVVQNGAFSKTFNAIYTDNVEPKLYAFWLDRYMLARQVRLNNDIINQNYVTGMDRLDPSFGKQVSITFTPTEDQTLKVSAVPYDPTWSLTNDYNRGYNNGYEDGLEEGQTPVSWIATTFDGIAGFFNIQVFPFVTLGFICFAPLIVVAIVAILRIIKHD